jgi:hypothetical protein
MPSNPSNSNAPAPDNELKNQKPIGYSDLVSSEMRRGMNFFETQHGPLKNWSPREIVDTIKVHQKTRHLTVMNTLPMDCWRLQRHYGAHPQEDHCCKMYFDYDEPEALPAGSSDCTLKVYPMDADSFDYWMIAGSGPEIFDPLQETTLVYLHLTFGSESKRSASFSMQDSILWFAGGKVMAHGIITEFHQDRVILLTDGLIAPVSVRLNPHRFTPFELEDWAIKDNTEAYQRLLIDESRPPERSPQVEISPITQNHRELPRLAHMFDSGLGGEILISIEYLKAES